MTTGNRLIIRIGREHLSFSTTDGLEVIYERYPLNSGISIAANFREALRTVPLLSVRYDHVCVMVSTPVLQVPVNLFREEEADMLYRHSFTDEGQFVVMYNVLTELSSVAVFAVQKDLRTVVGDAFGKVQYMPVVMPVWNHLHQRSYTGQHGKLYGYFHDRRMEVFSFAQNRFKFCNSFAVTNARDALYYLLAAWKQLGLDARHDELHLAGDLAERDELTAEAQQFVKRVFYINPSGEFNRAPVTQIAGMPYDLMTLYIKGR